MVQDNAEKPNVNSTPAPKAKKTPKKITEKYLHNAGLAYLQRFPASSKQFEGVMRRKIKKSCNYHKEQSMEDCLTLLAASVANFTRLGLLNDEGYLRGMVQSLTRRGLSRQAIMAKLSLKGFSNEAVLTALQTRMDESTANANYDLIAALRHAQRKKLGPFRTKTEFDRNKELASLARAGFGYDVAEKALGEAHEDAIKILSEFM